MSGETVWFTIGGSHRKYKRDAKTINAAGIACEWVGHVSVHSKLSVVSVAAEDASKMVSLGFHKCQRQPSAARLL